MVIGTVTLAPLSLPIIVTVLVKVVAAAPNKVLTVVPVKFIDVPITVFDTLVPKVVVVLSLSASAVLIPTPEKLDNILTSAIVTVYP